MAKRRYKQSLANSLRQAIRKSGHTTYSLGNEAGMGPEVVGRFLDGADIRISTAGKLAEVVGLELRPARKGKR